MKMIDELLVEPEKIPAPKIPENWVFVVADRAFDEHIFSWRRLTLGVLKELWVFYNKLPRIEGRPKKTRADARVLPTWQEWIGSKGIDRTTAFRHFRALGWLPPTEVLPTPPLLKGKFNVIYADPPWQYDNSGLGGAASKHYMTMPIDEVIGLKDKDGKTIQSCCAEDSVLFMWATNPFLKDAFDVIQAWGFSYKTNLCWLKKGRATYGKLGFYVYGKHELLLIATKGSFLPEGEKPISIVEAAKGKHSRKPDEFYEIIQKMYPQGKYLELFARRKYNDLWKTWGLEI